MQEMIKCSVSLLALYSSNKDSNTVLSYTEIIRNTEIEFDTKISFELHKCNFIDETGLLLMPIYMFGNMKLITTLWYQLCVRRQGNTFLPTRCVTPVL